MVSRKIHHVAIHSGFYTLDFYKVLRRTKDTVVNRACRKLKWKAVKIKLHIHIFHSFLVLLYCVHGKDVFFNRKIKFT